MEQQNKAKFYGEKIIELAEIINELLQEDEFDQAGAYLVDLEEYTTKLDDLIMKLI